MPIQLPHFLWRTVRYFLPSARLQSQTFGLDADYTPPNVPRNTETFGTGKSTLVDYSVGTKVRYRSKQGIWVDVNLIMGWLFPYRALIGCRSARSCSAGCMGLLCNQWQEGNVSVVKNLCSV